MPQPQPQSEPPVLMPGYCPLKHADLKHTAGWPSASRVATKLWSLAVNS